MSSIIAFVASERYQLYLLGVEESLISMGCRVDYYEPEAFCKLRDATSVDCVVTVHSIDKDLLETLRSVKGKVPTVTLQDGLIEYAHCCLKDSSSHRYRPVVTDYLFAFGEKQKKIAESRDQDACVIATGSPRFDAYQEYKSGLPDCHLPILVTTANTPWQDSSSRKRFRLSFVGLLKTLLSFGVEFRLRLPDKVKKELMMFSPLFYRKLNKSACCKGLNRTNVPLLEDILGSSAVVTTPSTVALEAMILDRPTAILQAGFYPMYLESAFHLSSEDSFQPVLSCMLKRDSDFDDRMAFQELIKSDNVLDDGKATKRVVKHILTVLNS